MSDVMSVVGTTFLHTAQTCAEPIQDAPEGAVLTQAAQACVALEQAVAATMGVATSTAMWEAGELTQEQYVAAVLVGSSIFGGQLPVLDGLKQLMGLWMGGPVAVPVGVNGTNGHSTRQD